MAKKKAALNLGAHMSIAGGVHLAIERGAEVGCETIQIFTKSSNQWRAKKLATDDVDAFHRLGEETGISPVIAHDSYLINLASPDPQLHKKSKDALAEELRRCDLLGIPYLVMHPGAHMGKGEAHAIRQIAESLSAILGAHEGEANICLETTAGQGTTIGHRFEHLGEIIDAVEGGDRIGVCVDTCHIFAAGYPVGTKAEWNRTFKAFDEAIGLDRIRCFHVNDSKREAGSRVDRHDHIGKGHMGLEPFRHLMNDRRFRAVPKVLETPKGKEMEEDRQNLRALRRLLKAS